MNGTVPGWSDKARPYAHLGRCRSDVIEEARDLLAHGATPCALPARLGVTRAALYRALSRAIERPASPRELLVARAIQVLVVRPNRRDWSEDTLPALQAKAWARLAELSDDQDLEGAA